MEKETIISGHQSLNIMTSYKNMSPEIQRLHFYQGKILTCRYVSRKETDTHVYWSFSEARPMFENGKLFYKRNSKSGATYDRAKRNIKIWYGQTMYSLHHEIKEDILKFFECEWVLAMNVNLQACVTGNLLNRIIKKRITNPRDFCRAYMRTSFLRTLNISPELFYKTFNNDELRYIRHPQAYKTHFLHATDPEAVLKIIHNEGAHGTQCAEFTDMIAQAAMLNKKYNPLWSEKRVKEVHQEWTRELMEIELKSLPKIDYDYVGVMPELEGLTLIRNNHELFNEGKSMSHCVYTNYNANVRRKDYFVFAYEYNGRRATVGVNSIPQDGQKLFVLNQMYGFRNCMIDEEHKVRVREWLLNPAVQSFLTLNSMAPMPVEENSEALLW